MPTILRNPFRKQDENARPSQTAHGIEQRVNGTGNAKAVDVPAEKEPVEYKLSEINDSGVYLPPSPTERKSFWSTASSRSTTSTKTRPSLLSGDDQFSISRESFDSYRRSFDISARSPVISASDNTRPPRASLDSRTFYAQQQPRASFESRNLQPPPARSSNSFTRPSQVPAETQEEDLPTTTAQEGFEDVDIADKPKAEPTNKRGLFSRITNFGDHSERPNSSSGSGEGGKSWHHFGGRKRGQSGQGAELGSIPKRETTPKPESQLKREVQTPGSQQKRGSVDAKTTKSAKDAVTKDVTPKAAKPANESSSQEHQQATAGAAAAQPESKLGESPVDSGVDIEGMKNVSLDDSAATPEVKKVLASSQPSSSASQQQQKEAGLKALQPSSSQAPEISSK